MSLTSPRAAKSKRGGMALIPEDRKTEGLMLPMSVRDNLSFAALDRLTRFGIVDRAAEHEAVDEMIRLLQIRVAETSAPANALSGGNQQKVVIAKWLMNRPRIILLNDPTRGIDVGTKQELYQLMRRLAAEGAAILFYSTDYDELIGLCDRVAVMYDGRIARLLVGAEITEKTLVTSALNIATGDDEGRPRQGGRRMRTSSYFVAEHKGTIVAFVTAVAFFVLYVSNHPAGLTGSVAATAANKGVLLALVAMAQTLPVLTAGLDLSVGMVFVLANCVASTLVFGTPLETAAGVVAVLLVGLACGALNGVIVVYGRLQPIITTLATGAIYYGLALLLRPVPGGDVNSDLADALTGQLPGGIPASLLFILMVVLVIWVPFRRSVLGRAAYAVGSSETAAYMSGVPIGRAKIAAYTLSGLLASIAGPDAHLHHLFRRGLGRQRRHLHPQLDRRRGDRRDLAVRRIGQRRRLDLRRLRAADDRRSFVRVRSGAVLAAAGPGHHPAGRGQPGRGEAAQDEKPPRCLHVTSRR